jgi:CRISPR/Cas system-associated protein Cas10 (large subunit of type III CRISPR-Cas system)
MMYIKKLKKYKYHKVCTLCKKKLLKKNFRKNARGYYASRCNKCTVDAQRESFLFKKYGITLKEYNTLLNNQNYTCAICKKPPQTKNRRLCVDHNHSTGEVRGLLCDLCNTALGKLQDDIGILKAAIKYLEKK